MLFKINKVKIWTICSNIKFIQTYERTEIWIRQEDISTEHFRVAETTVTSILEVTSFSCDWNT
jgi:hypothetical protein